MARSLLTGEVVTNEEIHYLRGDGKRVVLLANSAPVVDGAGRVTGAILSFMDVTEREAAAENIRRLEKRFSAIFISSPVAISLARAADQRYLDVNETWCRFFGYEREEVIGRTLGELETYEKETLDRMTEALGRSGSIQDLAARIRRKSGEIRDALLTVEPLNIGGETVLLRTLVDVSELQRAQADIRSLNEGLEQKVRERTQRLEETLKELESFSYTVAHDLRAPLRAMRGYCSILMEDFGRALGDEGRRSAGRIIEAGEQLETLIRDLLDYSRLARENMQLGLVDLDDVLSGVVGRFRETIGERKPEISLVSPMPPVVGDRLMLAQALTNLLSNAVKFVSPGVQPRVTVRAERRDGKVRIWIEDNGIGIPREHHETIFSVFRRLHGQEEYPGTGIGLSIVRKSVERMDGKVGLESEPGKGSKFWIELPAAADRPSPER